MRELNSIEKVKIDINSHILPDAASRFTVDDEIYTDFKSLTFFWEKTYVKQPERTQTGSLGDLNNNNATFVTAHFTVEFGLMSIDDFRRLMKQILGGTDAGVDGKNAFSVTVYDPIYRKEVTREMYVGTLQTPTYWTETLEDGRVALLGVQNYKIEFIGTNND